MNILGKMIYIWLQKKINIKCTVLIMSHLRAVTYASFNDTHREKLPEL